MNRKLGIASLRQYEMMRWDDGGIYIPGMLLPSDRNLDKVFDEEALTLIRSIRKGLFRDGICVESVPPPRDKVFPIYANYSLSYAAMDSKVHLTGLLPGERIHTELNSGLFGLVLSRIVNGQEELIVCNSAAVPALELGPFWYQDKEINGPIAVVHENMAGTSLIGKDLERGIVEAVIWPFDLSNYKDD